MVNDVLSCAHAQMEIWLMHWSKPASNSLALMFENERDERTAHSGRPWPRPMAALFVVGSSVVLWVGIFLLGNLLLS